MNHDIRAPFCYFSKYTVSHGYTKHSRDSTDASGNGCLVVVETNWSATRRANLTRLVTCTDFSKNGHRGNLLATTLPSSLSLSQSFPCPPFARRNLVMAANIIPVNADDDTSRPRKRLRPDPPSKRRKEPRLFVPFRALGLITNHVPFVLQTRSFKGATDGPRTHILTCLGKSWAMWEGGKMTLLFVSM